MAKFSSTNSNLIQAKEAIGANSAAFVANTLVSKSGGFLIPATTSGKIEGIVGYDVTMTSDNQTVAKTKVKYHLTKPFMQFEIATSGSTLAQADEGSYFNLSDANTVDYTTKSTVLSIVNTSDAGSATDPVVTKQVKLVKFVSQSASLYEAVL